MEQAASEAQRFRLGELADFRKVAVEPRLAAERGHRGQILLDGFVLTHLNEPSFRRSGWPASLASAGGSDHISFLSTREAFRVSSQFDDQRRHIDGQRGFELLLAPGDRMFEAEPGGVERLATEA